MKRVSVIVPSYRPEKYIEECIDSLYNQDIPGDCYEVILVLNGSEDNYYKYISSLISDKPQFKLINVAQPGVSNARNVGIDASEGDYITFVDDDDIVSGDYLSGLLAVADTNVMALSKIRSFEEQISNCSDNFFICKKFNNIQDYKDKPLVKQRSFISYVGGKLIPRSGIGDRRFNTKFRNGEDSLFMTSLTDIVDKVKYAESGIYYVRERIGSASRKPIPVLSLIIDSFLLILEYITIYFKHPAKYSFRLFLSRIPGVIKNAYSLLRYRQ